MAQTYNGNQNVSANWSTAADWNTNNGNVPGAATTDKATINLGTVVFDETANHNNIASLTLNGGNLVFNVNPATLNVTGGANLNSCSITPHPPPPPHTFSSPTRTLNLAP